MLVLKINTTVSANCLLTTPYQAAVSCCIVQVEFEPEEGLGEEGACGKKKGYGYMTVAIKKPSGTITLMVQSWTADGFQAPSDATEKWSGRGEDQCVTSM